MKKTLLFLALVVGASNISFAQSVKASGAQAPAATNKTATMQNPGTPEERGEQQAKHLKELLILNDQQYASVKQICTAKAVKMKEAHDKNDQSLAQSSREEAMTQIKALLTPEQKAKFDAQLAKVVEKSKAPQKKN